MVREDSIMIDTRHPTPDEDGIEIERWRSTVDEVAQLLQQHPERAENIWLKQMPKGSCSVFSFAVGATLLQRHGQRWLLVSRINATSSHTWLRGETTDGRMASIDATIQQFDRIAQEPFIGVGTSPAEEHFPDSLGADVWNDAVPPWWHHGQTREIYTWLFPRLGISTTVAGIGE
jgi:hypothetical protein